MEHGGADQGVAQLDDRLLERSELQTLTDVSGGEAGGSGHGLDDAFTTLARAGVPVELAGSHEHVAKTQHLGRSLDVGRGELGQVDLRGLHSFLSVFVVLKLRYLSQNRQRLVFGWFD